MVIEARKRGFNLMVVPWENAQEASYIGDIRILPVKHLSELAKVLNKQQSLRFFLSPNGIHPGRGERPILIFVISVGRKRPSAQWKLRRQADTIFS